MSIKGIGMIFIIAGCTGMGFSIAGSSKKELQLLRCLYAAIVCMKHKIEYDLSPLPDLCREAAKCTFGGAKEVFLNLARELDWQIAPDVYSCMHEALAKSRKLPSSVRRCFLRLGRSLGQFDLSGQIQSLEGVGESCHEEIMRLSENQENRLRSYRTLGICAGTALAILLV